MNSTYYPTGQCREGYEQQPVLYHDGEGGPSAYLPPMFQMRSYASRRPILMGSTLSLEKSFVGSLLVRTPSLYGSFSG